MKQTERDRKQTYIQAHANEKERRNGQYKNHEVVALTLLINTTAIKHYHILSTHPKNTHKLVN